jgi:hypothetical protein
MSPKTKPPTSDSPAPSSTATSATPAPVSPASPAAPAPPAPTTKADIARYRENLQGEVDAIALYALLLEKEQSRAVTDF